MKTISFAILVLFLTGCQMGNKYDYRVTNVTLPLKATDHKSLVLLVEDLRPYVLAGDKGPNFVGVRRDVSLTELHGVPYDVTTVTGKPMVEDMSAAITGGFNRAGYQVVNAQGKSEAQLISIANRESATRIVVLKILDWRSDAKRSVKLYCDLQLSVRDANGRPLAYSAMAFAEEIGGADLLSVDKNSRLVADEFAKRIGYLFNDKNVRSEL